ncbi:MAG: hypothetical protein A2X94_11855 [Bdellovibrionales bacterium GWB1_55_8]|nr:MAG: hypothetical protein A2X94_11855 [Bdellovibrionales bacterium GWB1_55_8]
MRLSVLSDLHIKGSEDPFYRSLLRVIGTASGEGDVIVLAGDIFDLFVGNKPVFIRRYSDFIWACQAALQRGVQIHYIEGNHDFLIRRAFRKMDGLFVHPQDVSLQMDQARFFIAHGDLVDRSDRSYLMLRKLFRSVAMKAFVRLAPGTVLDAVGRTSSRHSRSGRKKISGTPPKRSVFHAFACERIREGYDFVVLGHSHDADESSLAVDGRRGRYYNVGYPRVHGTYLVWTGAENGFRREPLPSAT